VVAILAFFAGLQRLGASRTAVLSTLEPVVTVGLATWLLAESLSVVQLTGGVLVLVAVGWQATVRRAVPAAEAAARLDATPPI
jgi:drug/metabolite transporter (DMT)-like permease